jgi:hypothetical protein
MRVESIHEGYTFSQVQQNCGFPLLQAKEIVTTSPPAKAELEILRREVDPKRLIIGR